MTWLVHFEMFRTMSRNKHNIIIDPLVCVRKLDAVCMFFDLTGMRRVVQQMDTDVILQTKGHHQGLNELAGSVSFESGKKMSEFSSFRIA